VSAKSDIRNIPAVPRNNLLRWGCGNQLQWDASQSQLSIEWILKAANRKRQCRVEAVATGSTKIKKVITLNQLLANVESI
jgi:hypothetical protein